MKIEDELKELILSKYKSIRAFTKDIDIPYSTLDTMLKRGISGASISSVLKICKNLGIDADSLMDNKIVFKSTLTNQLCEDKEIAFLMGQITADDNPKLKNLIKVLCSLEDESDLDLILNMAKKLSKKGE